MRNKRKQKHKRGGRQPSQLLLSPLAKIYKPIPVYVIGRYQKKEKVYRELPSLILESDIIDITSYSEVNTRNQIDAFIETLESNQAKTLEKE